MKTVWIDLLCWHSVWKLPFLLRQHSVEKVYYANTTIFFSPFIAFLTKMIQRPLIQILDIVEGEEKIRGVSLYEYLQQTLTNILDAWVQTKQVNKRNEYFCRQHGWNMDKYRAYLKETAYRHLYRPVEITIMAEKISGKDQAIYLLWKTPFADLLKTIVGKENLYMYNAFVLSWQSIIKRNNYDADLELNNFYYTNNVISIVDTLGRWFFISFFSTILDFFQRRKTVQIRPNTNIGVELFQSRIRLDEINEIFWLKDSGINERTVFALEMENFGDDSIKILKEMGTKRFKVLDTPRRLARFILTKQSSVWPSDLITPDWRYGLKTFSFILKLCFPLMSWNEINWLRYQEIKYLCRTLFWMSVYKILGIKIIFSMSDIDPEKLCKAQALEKLQGFYVGGHWSNTPMFVVLSQKCFDVMLTWGEHFITNNYTHYPFLGIFKVGYPSDHYFEKRKPQAIHLRNQYPGKFILSYQDNIMANDIAFSKGMQIQIHNMLISFLKRYEKVVVFLKPKRSCYFEAIVKELPELQKFMDDGRIVVFVGATHRTKAVPAEIGMASDLVIGLGISTPATECFLAGTIAFHADLTGFIHNQFGNDGLETIVFRDMGSLEKAVEGHITGSNRLAHVDYRKYYEALDPFRDGKTYLRVGFIIKKLQEGCRLGLDRSEIIERTKMEYDAYLKSRPAMVDQLNLATTVKN